MRAIDRGDTVIRSSRKGETVKNYTGGFKLFIAEHHCGWCGWEMSILPGNKVPIAGYPRLGLQKVRDVPHAEQILRAHVFMHNDIHKTRAAETREAANHVLHLTGFRK